MATRRGPQGRGAFFVSGGSRLPSVPLDDPEHLVVVIGVRGLDQVLRSGHDIDAANGPASECAFFV
jgi:hypothetical protein